MGVGGKMGRLRRAVTARQTWGRVVVVMGVLPLEKMRALRAGMSMPRRPRLRLWLFVRIV